MVTEVESLHYAGAQGGPRCGRRGVTVLWAEVECAECIHLSTRVAAPTSARTVDALRSVLDDLLVGYDVDTGYLAAELALALEGRSHFSEPPSR